VFVPSETPDWICTRSAECPDYEANATASWPCCPAPLNRNSWLAVRSIPGEVSGRRLPAPTGNVKTGLNSHLASIIPRALEHLHAVDPISRPAEALYLARVCESFPKTHFCSRCSPYSVRFGRSGCLNSASSTPRLCPPCSVFPPSTNCVRRAAAFSQSAIRLCFRNKHDDQLENKNVLTPPECNQSKKRLNWKWLILLTWMYGCCGCWYFSTLSKQSFSLC